MNRIITVMGTPDVAVEFGSVIATYSDSTVLLIDLDTMHPSFDLILKVKPEPKDVTVFKEDELNTGLNLVIDAIDKNLLSKEFLFKCLQNRRKNLYILTGNYSLDNYEYMREEPIEELIQKTSEIFNTVILSVTTDIYDSYTYLAARKADIVIVPVKADAIEIRNINNDIEYLISNRKLNKNKFRQILFSYKKDHNLSVPIVSQLCKFSFLGVIPFSEQRDMAHNTNVIYIKKMERQVVKQYKKISSKCGINVSKPFIRKLNRREKLLRLISNTIKKKSILKTYQSEKKVF